MSIANDAWIRKMALEHGMITPFEEGQVGKGKISYGVSSYGYDVRVGSHFKIFHNLHSTLVDPKHFDARSFVDHDGEMCIIPPNSFVLAETVERFKIPRNVLCVCLGKCVTGDTRVVDAETGAYLPIREFAGRRATVGLDGWISSRLPVSDFIPQGRKPVFELRTKLGLRIRATSNHPFRQLTGWTALSDLRVGDRIAAARTVPVFGTTPLPTWEAALLGLMISEGQCKTPGYSPVFTNADPVLVELARASAREGLGVETTQACVTTWLEGHGFAREGAESSVPNAVFTAPADAVRTFLSALFTVDGRIEGAGDAATFAYASTSRRLVEDVRHLLLRFGIVSLLGSESAQRGATAHHVHITDRDAVLRFAEQIGFWTGSEKHIRVETEVLPGLRLHGWELAAVGRSDRSARATGMSRLGSRQLMPALSGAIVAPVGGDEDLSDLSIAGPVWDVVESIEPAGEEEVYDISVPGAENFFANDLVVHNSTYARCGIIVNVTPLEPEWEGIVTIEISNTTPLPAKIYANEGIAQILFFKADPDGICETSYGDRKGKYQNQPGLTLPKIL